VANYKYGMANTVSVSREVLDMAIVGSAQTVHNQILKIQAVPATPTLKYSH
jgi:hypothetical protein